MSKTITRQLLKLFGSSGASGNFGQFGSKLAGSPITTKDVPTIQGLSAWLNGMQDAVVAANKAPYLEDHNGLFYVLCYQLFYLLQEGIPEWDANTTYFIGGIVKKAGTSELYSSLVDDNLNNALPSQQDSAFWKFFSQPPTGYKRPVLQYVSASTVKVEVNTGSANTTSILFPNNNLRTVTEDVSSGTPKYRLFDITKTANFVSGTESSGLRSGISETANTWYALYAVQSQIDTTKFVLVGDTTLPLQANFSTLNGRYGTNGWLYLGMIRNGQGIGAPSDTDSDIVSFRMSGDRTMCMPFSGISAVTFGLGIQLSAVAITGGSATEVVLYSVSRGVSAGQMPDHIQIATYGVTIDKAGNTSNFGTLNIVQSNGDIQLQFGGFDSFPGIISGERNSGIQFEQAVDASIFIQRTTAWPSTATIYTFLRGWDDPILAGLNNAI